jgi:hypothetical protein
MFGTILGVMILYFSAWRVASPKHQRTGVKGEYQSLIPNHSAEPPVRSSSVFIADLRLRLNRGVVPSS